MTNNTDTSNDYGRPNVDEYNPELEYILPRITNLSVSGTLTITKLVIGGENTTGKNHSVKTTLKLPYIKNWEKFDKDSRKIESKFNTENHKITTFKEYFQTFCERGGADALPSDLCKFEAVSYCNTEGQPNIPSIGGNMRAIFPLNYYHASNASDKSKNPPNYTAVVRDLSQGNLYKSNTNIFESVNAISIMLSALNEDYMVEWNQMITRYSNNTKWHIWSDTEMHSLRYFATRVKDECKYEDESSNTSKTKSNGASVSGQSASDILKGGNRTTSDSNTVIPGKLEDVTVLGEGEKQSLETMGNYVIFGLAPEKRKSLLENTDNLRKTTEGILWKINQIIDYVIEHNLRDVDQGFQNLLVDLFGTKSANGFYKVNDYMFLTLTLPLLVSYIGGELEEQCYHHGLAYCGFLPKGVEVKDNKISSENYSKCSPYACPFVNEPFQGDDLTGVNNSSVDNTSYYKDFVDPARVCKRNFVFGDNVIGGKPSTSTTLGTNTINNNYNIINITKQTVQYWLTMVTYLHGARVILRDIRKLIYRHPVLLFMHYAHKPLCDLMAKMASADFGASTNGFFYSVIANPPIAPVIFTMNNNAAGQHLILPNDIYYSEYEIAKMKDYTNSFSFVETSNNSNNTIGFNKNVTIMTKINSKASTDANNYFDRFTSDCISNPISVYTNYRYPAYDNTFRINFILPGSVYEVADLAESSCVTTSMVSKLIYYDSSSSPVTSCDNYPKIILTPDPKNSAYTAVTIGQADSTKKHYAVHVPIITFQRLGYNLSTSVLTELGSYSDSYKICINTSNYEQKENNQATTTTVDISNVYDSNLMYMYTQKPESVVTSVVKGTVHIGTPELFKYSSTGNGVNYYPKVLEVGYTPQENTNYAYCLSSKQSDNNNYIYLKE